jgi:hypothetical protein
MAHLFRAQSRGGNTVVPTCNDCNWKQGTMGPVTYLKYLHDNDNERFKQIREYHYYKSNEISEIVNAVYDHNYGVIARLKQWFS